MSTEDIVYGRMTTDTGLEVEACCVHTNSPPLRSPHVHCVLWLRVIGSVVIIALRGAVLLLQPGGLKEKGAHYF